MRLAMPAPQLQLDLSGPRRRESQTFGIYAYVGPPGSGKTLLALSHLIPYYQGRVRRPDGSCLCDAGAECRESWTVYSNIPSTIVGQTNRHGTPGWAQPLDVAGELLDTGSELSHSYILLDEGHNYADSRRAMKSSNLDAARFCQQIRKRDTKLAITAQAFDTIDRRIRDLVMMSFECWTRDSGQTVNAVVSEMARGDLPPWIRNRARDQLRRYRTAWARRWYDTRDRIDAAELASNRERMIYLVKDGQPQRYPVAGIVIDEVHAAAARGETEIDPEELAAELAARYGVPITPSYVRLTLFGEGLSTAGAGSGRFVIAGRAQP